MLCRTDYKKHKLQLELLVSCLMITQNVYAQIGSSGSPVPKYNNYVYAAQV